MKDIQYSLDFDNSNSDDLKLLLYTTNRNAREYFCADTIACNAFLESGQVDSIISNIRDYGILLTHQKLDTRHIENNSIIGIYSKPLIMEITIPANLGDSISALIMNNRNEARINEISKYDMLSDSVAFIIGNIPISYVSKVYFDKKETFDSFYLPVSNIHFPEELYEINSKYYDGSQYVDWDTLGIAIEGYFADNINNLDDIICTLKIRDKIKAAIISAGFDLRNFVGDYSLNFDSDFLRLLGEDIKKIKAMLSEKKINLEDYTRIKDTSVFPTTRELLMRLTSKKTNSLLSKFKAESISEIVAYEATIKLLLSQQNNNIGSIDWLKDFTTNLEKAFRENNIYSTQYHHYFSRIQDTEKVLNNQLYITDVIKANRSETPFLNAVMIIAKNVHNSDIRRIEEEMRQFKFTIHEKRVVRFLFGCHSGTSFLISKMKNDPALNSISDNISMEMLPSELLINHCPVRKNISYNDRMTLNFETDNGFMLKITKESTTDEMRLTILKTLSNRKRSKERDALVKFVITSIVIPIISNPNDFQKYYEENPEEWQKFISPTKN